MIAQSSAMIVGSRRMSSRQLAADRLLEIALAPRSVLRLAGDHRGLCIRCTSNALWITQDGDPDDICLGAGEQFSVTRPGPVVLQGLNTPIITRWLARPEHCDGRR